jgi:hypothetical protein
MRRILLGAALSTTLALAACGDEQINNTGTPIPGANDGKGGGAGGAGGGSGNPGGIGTTSPALVNNRDVAVQMMRGLNEVSVGASFMSIAPMTPSLEAKSVTVERNCPQGGKVTVNTQLRATEPTALVLREDVSLFFERCTLDGQRFFDGSVLAQRSMQVIRGGTGSFSRSADLTGRLNISGNATDVLDVSLSEIYEVSAAAHAHVVKVNGTLATLLAKYEFNNEAFSIASQGGVVP